jgi:amino acid permease
MDSSVENLIVDKEINSSTNKNTSTKSLKRNFLDRAFSPVKEGSLRGSTIALASITFGSGCLSFPYAVAQVGPILAVIIFILVACFSYFTLRIIIEIGFDQGVWEYNDLIKKYIGDKWLFFSDINNIILCSGLIIGYQYTISKFTLEVMESLFDIDCQNVKIKIIQMSICMIFQIFLSSFKDMSKLQYVSMIGSFALIYTIVIVVVEMPFYLYEYLKSNTIVYFVPITWNILDTLSIFVFGFSSHNGALPVYTDLKRRTDERVFKVLNRSVSLEIILYIFISFGGFFSSFYSSPDVFLRRPDLPGFIDYYIIIAKVTLIICLHCIMAINYNIMRFSIKTMFFNNIQPRFSIDFTIVVISYIFMNVVCFFVENVVDVLNIIGGVSTTTICFISPLIIYTRWNKFCKYHYKNIIAYILIFISVLFAVGATFKGILNFIEKLSKPT